jgi:hypothetical protein
MNGLPFITGFGRRGETGVIRHRRLVGLRATARATFLKDSPIPAGVFTGFLGHLEFTSFPAQQRTKRSW